MSFTAYFNCYSNVATAISNANPGVVTTAVNHGYSNGLYVRLVIPQGFGMSQANGNVYLITVLSPTTFSLNADTSNFDPYLGPSEIVTNIMQSNPCVVTVLANRFKINQYVFIQGVSGMVEVNNKAYVITNVEGNNITLNLNSSTFTPYAFGGVVSATEVSQVIPVGEVSNTLLNAEINNRNIVPQSTDNTN